MDFHLSDFGAAGNGAAPDTAAVQAALDACAAAGGGRVVADAGTYRIGTIWLRDNVELYLSRGAVLKASTDLADYNRADAYPQNFSCPQEEWNACHLILAVAVRGAALTGPGAVDGSGPDFYCDPIPWSPYIWRDGLALARDKKALRPGQLVSFVECRDVRVEDVTLRNATCWACHVFGCENVSIRGLRVFNPPTYANTDGIDIDASRKVTVSDCIVDTGDDALAIRCDGARLKREDAVCEDVAVSNCVFSSSSALIRIGVGRGTIRRVRVDGIVCSRCGHGLYVTSNLSERCATRVEDVSVRNVEAADVGVAVFLSEGTGVPIRRFTLENCRFRSRGGARFHAATKGAVSELTLRNVTLALEPNGIELTEENLGERGRAALELCGVEGLTLDGVRVSVPASERAKWERTVDVTDCPGARIRELSLD